MTFKKLAIPFAFAAGLASGIGGTLYFAGGEPADTAPLKPGDRISANVVSVYDGDTFTVESGSQTYQIRVWGIDAPELAQRCLNKGGNTVTCGHSARDTLRGMIEDKQLSCEIKALDTRYDRLIARCFNGSSDPVAALVRQGWAYADRTYSNAPYAAEESAAKSQRAGLWALTVMPPADWRSCKSWQGHTENAPEKCFKPLGPLNP